MLNPITSLASAEAGTILKIDEAAGVVFYTARDGDNYMKMQLHRVGLNGKGDVRLTDPKFNHSVGACGAGGGGGGRGGGGGGAERARSRPTTSISSTSIRDDTAGHAGRGCDERQGNGVSSRRAT